MKNALQVFPSPPLTCRLSIFIVSSLVVSCHGEHVDVKVFILFPSSLRILLLMIFECIWANRSMERGPSGWRTSDESGKGAAELDRRRNPLSFLFPFPSCLFLFLFLFFGAWCLENPLPQGISWLEPDWQPDWHFQHQEERNAAKIFTRPTHRNDTKLDSGAINSSTGSKLWYESEQMFRLPSYLKKSPKPHDEDQFPMII